VTKYPIVITRFQGFELNNHSPMIYAYRQNNIAVTGSGTLDASGTSTWNKTAGAAISQSTTWSNNKTPLSQRNLPSGESLPVAFVEPYNCTNVYIQGITLKNAQWWQFHPTLSTNVRVSGVKPTGTKGNTDGCDPEASTNVVIENATMQTGDDSTAIKSGCDNDGRVAPSLGYGVPTSNVVITNLTAHLYQNANGGMVTIGSEESGGVQHVYAYNINSNGTNGRLLYMKSNNQRGGYVNDIHVDTANIQGLKDPIAYITLLYSASGNGGPTGFMPTFKNITISNTTISGFPSLLSIQGLSNDTIGPVTFTNNTWTNSTNVGGTTQYASVTYSNTKFNGTEL
jgi:polygalacturonase